MNELPQVFNYKNHQVRTFLIDGEPWWAVKDVCDALDIGNPKEVREMKVFAVVSFTAKTGPEDFWGIKSFEIEKIFKEKQYAANYMIYLQEKELKENGKITRFYDILETTLS